MFLRAASLIVGQGVIRPRYPLSKSSVQSVQMAPLVVFFLDGAEFLQFASIPGAAATALAASHVSCDCACPSQLPPGGGPSPGCGGPVDLLGDHALACPRTGLRARRAKVVERAWIRVAREAVGPEGHIVPQPWLAHTTAPRVETTDRRPGLAHLWGDAQMDRVVLRRHAHFAVATEPRCALPSGANGQHTRNLRLPARSASSYLGRRGHSSRLVATRTSTLTPRMHQKCAVFWRH